jgi:hypothetical protein
MPVTITRKISGAMIILMSWMKPSPAAGALRRWSGQVWPMRTPATTAIRIWKKSDLYSGFFFAGPNSPSAPRNLGSSLI